MATDEAHALLRSAHPLLKTLNKDNFTQFLVYVTTWKRQREIDREDAVLDDPFVVPLSKEVGEVFYRIFPFHLTDNEITNFVNLRAYCNDQVLMRHDPMIRQVVMISGGLDTRAFRIKEIADCDVFELHANAAIGEHKEKVMADLGAEITAKSRTVVFTAFHDDSWQQKLVKAGFDPTVPTFWILESTMHFISPDEVMPLLRGIDFLSAPHSQMVTERVLGGQVDLVCDEEDEHQVNILVEKGRYGEDGGVFRELDWTVELLMRRNQACEYYGTMWDPERFDRFRVTGAEATMGPWFLALFSKPE